MKKRMLCIFAVLFAFFGAAAETPLVFLGEPIAGSPDHLMATLQANGFDVHLNDSMPGRTKLCGYLNGILTDVEIITGSDLRKLQMVVVRNNTPDYEQNTNMYKSQLLWMTKQYGKPVTTGTVNGDSYARWMYSDSEPTSRGNRQDIVLKTSSNAYVEIFFREQPTYVFSGYWDIAERDLNVRSKKYMKGYKPLSNPYESITNQRFADSRLDAQRAEKRAVRKEKVGAAVDWTKNLFKKKPKKDLGEYEYIGEEEDSLAQDTGFLYETEYSQESKTSEVQAEPDEIESEE